MVLAPPELSLPWGPSLREFAPLLRVQGPGSRWECSLGWAL